MYGNCIVKRVLKCALPQGMAMHLLYVWCNAVQLTLHYTIKPNAQHLKAIAKKKKKRRRYDGDADVSEGALK